MGIRTLFLTILFCIASLIVYLGTYIFNKEMNTTFICITKDISLAFFTSLLFYILVSGYPEYRRKKEIIKSIKQRYFCVRENIILFLLRMIQQPANKEVEEAQKNSFNIAKDFNKTYQIIWKYYDAILVNMRDQS